MEIVFVLIAIIASLITIYSLGKVNYDHKGLIDLYKESDFLFLIHFFLGAIMTMLFFVTLCASNNTYWHLHH